MVCLDVYDLPVYLSRCRELVIQDYVDRGSDAYGCCPVYDKWFSNLQGIRGINIDLVCRYASHQKE